MLTNLLWIGAAIVVAAIVAGVIFWIVSSQSEEVGDQAANINRGDIAIYNVNCNVNAAETVGRIARVEALDNPVNHIVIPWNAAGGYGVPTAAAVTTSATVGTANQGVLSVTADTDIGFLGAASRATEARYNADFNGNGEIETSEVVGVIETAAANMTGIVANTVTPSSLIDSHSNTNGDDFMLADPTANITNLQVGQRLVVNRAQSCWRVV